MKIEDIIATATRVGESVKAARQAAHSKKVVQPMVWYEALRVIDEQIWPHLPPRYYMASNWRIAATLKPLTGYEPAGVPVVFELRLDEGRHLGILTVYGPDAIAARLELAHFLGIEIEKPFIRCEGWGAKADCSTVFPADRQHCPTCRTEPTT